MSNKIELLEFYNIKSNNTGSFAAQIIFLAEKIRNVINHLSKNKKDIPAKRSMLRLLATQRKFLSILQKKDPDFYLNFHQEFFKRRGY